MDAVYSTWLLSFGLGASLMVIGLIRLDRRIGAESAALIQFGLGGLVVFAGAYVGWVMAFGLMGWLFGWLAGAFAVFAACIIAALVTAPLE